MGLLTDFLPATVASTRDGQTPAHVAATIRAEMAAWSPRQLKRDYKPAYTPSNQAAITQRVGVVGHAATFNL